MKMKSKAIIVLISFIILSKWIYPIVVGLWASIFIPLTSKLAPSAFVRGAWLAAVAGTGALIPALILALPLGYSMKEKPIFLGVGLGLIGAAVHIYDFPSSIMQLNWFSGTISVSEHLSFILGCVVFAKLGSVLSDRREGQPAPRP